MRSRLGGVLNYYCREAHEVWRRTFGRYGIGRVGSGQTATGGPSSGRTCRGEKRGAIMRPSHRLSVEALAEVADNAAIRHKPLTIQTTWRLCPISRACPAIHAAAR
jgi:hypothetical protein